MITQGTILEDDGAIADVLGDVLTDEGYTVQIASNGCDALAIFQTDGFELAPVDTYLPSTTGWELLEAARAQPIDVPIVVMTTSTLAAEALAATGAHACLFKSFELDDLLRCVTQYIRRC
jgi:two-component system, OmpR family, response regulator QseB